MLPSFVSNLIWGEDAAKQQENAVLDEPNGLICEEHDDWMVVGCTKEAIGEPVTENESVCSEISEHSWVVEPSPTFRTSTCSSLSNHSLEDLLIENPTMSMYKNSIANRNKLNPATTHNPSQDETKDPKNMQIQLRNQNTQLVLYRQNHARHLLAAEMGIPACPERMQKLQIDASSSSRPKVCGKKHPPSKQTFIRVSRGKKAFKIHQCGVKAGKRRS